MREGAKKLFARKLRREMTDAERCLWAHLRRQQLAGFRFRRQFPVGPYIVDFMCLEAKLVIEVDGGQHLESAFDAARSKWLGGQGLGILRFWNHDVLMRTDDVLAVILCVLAPDARLPNPSPQAEEGVKSGCDSLPPFTGEGAPQGGRGQMRMKSSNG